MVESLRQHNDKMVANARVRLENAINMILTGQAEAVSVKVWRHKDSQKMREPRSLIEN